MVPDTEVMPGDIIILREGEKVPADARIIFGNTLKIDGSEPYWRIRTSD